MEGPVWLSSRSRCCCCSSFPTSPLPPSLPLRPSPPPPSLAQTSETLALPVVRGLGERISQQHAKLFDEIDNVQKSMVERAESLEHQFSAVSSAAFLCFRCVGSVDSAGGAIASFTILRDRPVPRGHNCMAVGRRRRLASLVYMAGSMILSTPPRRRRLRTSS
ncbi:unnamed protein product [Prorocentrum cordatum]|uniref:t-SNARE coiled-coil homology domain-containing protein n=1 Tax=Prorocentrum cordatum TaxID=2364126 RepID=A0ABN9QQV1_9DINO|nr:unnamed protein product [Polarella glacialis]